LLVSFLGGCGLYFGGGGGGSDALICNTPVATPPAEELRDPYTGQCEPFGGGGCGPCEPCEGDNGAIRPNWASCSSTCLGRPEAGCFATPGCQAEYLDASYWGCFPVEPYGSTPTTTDCTQLDAYTCSQNDTCVEIYTSDTTSTTKTATKFARCAAENPLPPPPPPPPPPACDTLTTEMDCTARGDCDAVYNGYDCVCDASGCVCKTEVFAFCQAP
jgi:hypothetical protein